MKKSLRWLLLGLALVGALWLTAQKYYVLDSRKLDAAIRAELPPGTTKERVIHFVQLRKPLFCDDLGSHVKARITGRAENLIYRTDVVLDFEFDPDGKLMSYSKNVSLTFL